jgi:hypothetical protein
MYVLLRRVLLANPSGLSAAPFTAFSDFFDTVNRKPYSTQEDSQVNNPFELPKDKEVYRYEYQRGKTRAVYYNGNGSVYTKNLAASAGPFSPTLKIKATPAATFTSGSGAADACVDVTGQDGFPPYQLEVVGETGAAKGYLQTAVSQSEIYPVRFYNLAPGTYTLRVRDQTGDGRTQTLAVTAGTFQPDSRGALIQEVTQYQGGAFGLRTKWSYNNLLVLSYGMPPHLITPAQTPYGALLDGFLLPGSAGKTWRQVYSDGKQGVYFVDASTVAGSSLALDNLILFNPDTTAEQNGGAIVEVRGAALPLSFTLLGSGAVNATGRFDGLAGGEYQVRVTDALEGELTVSFTLVDKYRQWKYERYFDLDGTSHRVELWRWGFDGVPGRIQGAGQPVLVKSDGLQSSLGGQGDLPSVVGTSLELNFLTEIDLFEEVVIGDDRNCRVDYYYNGQLYFRGYLKPDIYTAPLLDGLQPVSLTATDGLADLKDVDMLGHQEQRLGGHRPVLHTLLHCLSRCQVALPLRIYTNRRDAAMATRDAPEEWATTNRTGYYDEDKGEPADQRTVVDALAQLLGGTLVQRAGAWEIRSALEAALPAEGRAYLPAGTPQGEALAEAPTGTILPPGENRWHWIDSVQTRQTRPGWKSLKGETDAGWLKNAFWPGGVFSDVNAWLQDGSQLRSLSGWSAPTGSSFPLVLQRVGEKGKDRSALWPRSLNLSLRDGRSLQSPTLPLATGPEAVPAFLTLAGKLLPADTYLDYEGNAMSSPGTAPVAYLPYEVLVDGRSLGVQLATFKLVADNKDTPLEVPLRPLPSGAQAAVLRVYTWLAPDTGVADSATLYFHYQPYKQGDVVSYDRGAGRGKEFFVARRDQAPQDLFPLPDPATVLPLTEWAPVVLTNVATGQLLLSSIGIQLRPQNATWDGKDNFRADGPGGNVRPTEPLKVYHPDVPISAGLFSGNLFAFGKGVGLLDGSMTTSWSRAIDKAASPLFEANVYDQLALRANPSRLVPGTIRHHHAAPPLLLDSVDTPYDVPGRRFLVGASTWDTQAAQTEVSLLEIGVGADAEPPALPAGARLTHELYQYTPGKYAFRARAVHGGGVRRSH